MALIHRKIVTNIYVIQNIINTASLVLFDEVPAWVSLFLLAKGGMQGILGKFSPGIYSVSVADEVAVACWVVKTVVEVVDVVEVEVVVEVVEVDVVALASAMHIT